MSVEPIREDLFSSSLRHVAVFAHQDDEAGYAGLLARIAQKADLVWVTNGDGLAPFEKAEPVSYGAMRESESAAACRVLGYAKERLHFLHHSELFLYNLMHELAVLPQNDKPSADLCDRIRNVSNQIQTEIEVVVSNADVVWTVAFQGGHPEHDLTHYLTMRAVQHQRSQGRRIRLYELPEYELTVLVPLRFPPWRLRPYHVIELSDQEMNLKQAAFECYPSQKKIIDAFDKLISFYGALSALRLKPFTFKSFARLEQFAEVPPRDYTKSPHILPVLDYINEDHEGVRIGFDNVVSRWIGILRA